MPSETTGAAQGREGITGQDAQMYYVWGVVVFVSPLKLGGDR